ncbi:MAG TPA: permease [Pyrinomonadaceae bacterium]|nr:permease [Pyrinomonadaceae bacterium]
MLAALLLLVTVGGLIAYKATASLAVIGKVQTTGVLKARFDLVPPASAPFWSGVLDRTLSYFGAVWPALLFGVLISGAVRAFVSPRWLAGLFGRGRVRGQVVAGLAGAPLMLCSCCVAPVFTSVYERSSRLAPSLALMLAAPSLNPAALFLTFLLFGAKFGAARLLAAGVCVLLTGVLAERVLKADPAACATESVTNGGAANAATMNAAGLDPADAAGVGSTAALFVRSCLKVALQTVPLIVAGVFVSMLVARWLPVGGLGSTNAQALAVVLVALVAVPLAMPTFFEIPLALLLLAAGMPAGAAVALLVAGPATNLPSLFTVARSTGWRVPALVGASVWAIAAAAGLLVNYV